MPRRRSPAQLDREIATALATRGRRHHATRAPSIDDEWDVAMDALLEHDVKRAAKLVADIRAEHGATVNPPQRFSDVVLALPGRVRESFLKATDPGKLKPPAKAVNFFRKHAGYSHGEGESKRQARTRNATNLARAEMEAEERGWTVEWEHDPEEWQGDTERPFEVLVATLFDADGNVLDSTGNIGMTGNRKQDADHRRLVEAELAAAALP